MKPLYLQSHEKGLLSRKIEQARKISRECVLCPRKCGVNRQENETGFCSTGRMAQVASWNLHFGEEEPLVGQGGSGTVFFAHCNLGCVFCQNHEISGNNTSHQEVSASGLADIFLELQSAGARNINLVTPSHVVLQVLEGLSAAACRGLGIPLVYNTGSYDEVNTLKLLDGVVDIYLADSKFFDGKIAEKYAQAPDYPEKARKAILEMHRQVGSLVMDRQGTAIKGLMIRHLVMPGDLAGSEDWLKFFAAWLPGDTYINIMDQYRPAGEAFRYPELTANVPGSRVMDLKKKARELGLKRLDKGPSGIFRLMF
jgi:putative pyruvate formate lyase activating enzyme